MSGHGKKQFQPLIFPLTQPRWDTLLYGQIDRLPLDVVPDEAKPNNLCRLNPRPPEFAHDPAELERAQMLFERISANIEFHLGSERREPHTALERPWRVLAETVSQYDGPTIIWFSTEILEPLLSPNITTAERMLCHFRVASTVIHEFTVSRLRFYVGAHVPIKTVAKSPFT